MTVERALRLIAGAFVTISVILAVWVNPWWLEKPGVVLVMRNGNDSRHDKAGCDIEWFIREGSLWRRRHERVDEVCWSADEIRRTLEEAGFDRLRAWDEAPFFKGNPLIGPGCRTVYLARKSSA